MSLSKWALTGALTAFTVSASAASVGVYAYTEAFIFDADLKRLDDFGTVTSTSTYSGIGLAGSGFGMASAAPGELKLSGKAVATGGPVSHGYSSTSAGITDTITLSTGNQLTSAVRVYYSLYLDAKLSTLYLDPTLDDLGRPYAYTSWTFEHQVEGNEKASIFHSEAAYGPTGIVTPSTEVQGYAGPITGKMDFVATITPGQATSFSAKLAGSARPEGSWGNIEFIGEVGLNTLHWGGISRVEDLAGQQITDFAVASELGIDYYRNYAAVPEPGTVLLFSAGVGVLLMLRRRVPGNRCHLCRATAAT